MAKETLPARLVDVQSAETSWELRFAEAERFAASHLRKAQLPLMQIKIILTFFRSNADETVLLDAYTGAIAQKIKNIADLLRPILLMKRGLEEPVLTGARQREALLACKVAHDINNMLTFIGGNVEFMDLFPLEKKDFVNKAWTALLLMEDTLNEALEGPQKKAKIWLRFWAHCLQLRSRLKVL